MDENRSKSPPKIALGPFLRSCPSVLTLGIRPAMGDYSREERELMRLTEKVYFPSMRFVSIFQAIEKPTFPSPTTYLFRRSRLHQHIFFKVLGIPHGKTRIYFGRRQKERMRSEFSLPVEIMDRTTRTGSIHHASDWTCAYQYAEASNPIIVREARPVREYVRLNCVAFTCVGAEGFIYREGHLTRVGPVPLGEPSLLTAIGKTETLARSCGLDDIAFDWGLVDDEWQLLHLAHPPLRIEAPGHTLWRLEYIRELVEKDAL